MAHYLFTTFDAKKIVAVKECPGLSTEALQVRRDLAEERHEEVVAWSCMGGDNPKPAPRS
jgi:hypothetical protein